MTEGTELVFEQRALLHSGLVQRFEFGAQELRQSQTLRWANKRGGFTISYTDIPKAYVSTFLAKKPLQTVIAAFMVVFVALAFGTIRHAPIQGLAAVAATIVLGVTLRSRCNTHIHQFTTPLGKIQVLADAQAAAILAEIAGRRRALLLARYDRLVFARLDHEAQRTLIWLRDQGHIEEPEFMTRLAVLDRALGREALALIAPQSSVSPISVGFGYVPPARPE